MKVRIQRRDVRLFLPVRQEADTATDHINSRTRVIHGRRQGPTGDFSQHDQAESRIIGKGAHISQHHGTVHAFRLFLSKLPRADNQQTLAGKHKTAGHALQIQLNFGLLCQLLQAGHVDMLNVTGRPGGNDLPITRQVAIKGLRAKKGTLSTPCNRRDGCILDSLERIPHATEIHQQADPADQRKNHPADHQQRHQEQHELRIAIVEPGSQGNFAQQTKHKGPQKSRQYILCGWVLLQQRRCPGCCASCRRRECGYGYRE